MYGINVELVHASGAAGAVIEPTDPSAFASGYNGYHLPVLRLQSAENAWWENIKSEAGIQRPDRSCLGENSSHRLDNTSCLRENSGHRFDNTSRLRENSSYRFKNTSCLRENSGHRFENTSYLRENSSHRFDNTSSGNWVN